MQKPREEMQNSQRKTTNELNIYGEELKKIPTPQYIVFYNGSKDYDAVKKLRLSDAFINQDKSGDFEWTATVYNLNRGKNDGLLKKCKPLSDYMEFVNRVNDYKKRGMDLEDAVDNAVNSCIRDGIMEEFLIKHKAEVKAMCITEFNEKVYEDGIREEGRKEGTREIILNMHKQGLSTDDIARFSAVDIKTVLQILELKG